MKQTRNISQRILMARLRAERAGRDTSCYPARSRRVRTANPTEPSESSFDRFLRTHSAFRTPHSEL